MIFYAEVSVLRFCFSISWWSPLFFSGLYTLYKKKWDLEKMRKLDKTKKHVDAIFILELKQKGKKLVWDYIGYSYNRLGWKKCPCSGKGNRRIHRHRRQNPTTRLKMWIPTRIQLISLRSCSSRIWNPPWCRKACAIRPRTFIQPISCPHPPINWRRLNRALSFKTISPTRLTEI